MSQATALPASAKFETLGERYQAVRQFSQQLAEPLSPEDCAVQSMPDASPTKWHLAHTTWFFETFLLSDLAGYQPFSEEFRYLYNSYYNTVGDQFPRPQRGLMSRPAFEQVLQYREHVDSALQPLLSTPTETAQRIVEIGLHHEQQHQELMLTDIKHALSCNPLLPAYQQGAGIAEAEPLASDWLEFDEGLHEIGHSGNRFAYDNESPRHRVFCEAFQVADRPVTCGEYLRFMQDGGYESPEHWLSLGWTAVGEQGWRAPLYWFEQDGHWQCFTLAGPRPVDPHAPVCHVSYFEADAYARWAGARLPTEAEWEVASSKLPSSGCFADQLLTQGKTFHPGRTWEWTASPYTPYPGYTPPDGALGEYNGKFMCNQYVLRGGSCATHSTHIRPTYRNFFPPDARWQFTGIRLTRFG